MESQDPRINEVLNEFLEERRVLEEKLQQCEKKRREIGSKCTPERNNLLANDVSIEKEASLLRNQRLLKDLEKLKARLRTLATFSPTDQELRDLAKLYRSYLTKNQVYVC